MTDDTNTPKRPAEGLVGITLPSGWLIEEQVAAYAGKTGGTFCVGYRGSRDGKKGFVKIVDIMGNLDLSQDFVTALFNATAAVRAERAVLEVCGNKRLSRIVQLLDHGQYKVPGYAGHPKENVFYFVFELAECDVRQPLKPDDPAQVAWKLRVLSDVALAVDQLSRVGVAHQDIKPSNVLMMTAMSTEALHKLGDLGRAIQKEVSGPFDGEVFPGDTRYAPLSAYYGIRETEWTNGRTSTDLYMLGLLTAFLFTGVNMTALQQLRTPDVLTHGKWPGTFQEALPHLINIHAQAIEELKDSFPPQWRDQLVSLVRELTHPDPCVRGDPRSRQKVGHPPGTEVYVSRFGLMAKRAALGRAA